ncbi:MAG: hypothetical protein EOL91_13250 [Actinobacteria bacterium]|nr:hypothetical protein [Actinomycetota bacterium]
MSALTDRIAAEHRIVHLGFYNNVERLACEGCDWRATVLDGAEGRRAHIAEVTEDAVRERVARDIEDRFAPVLAVAGVVRVAIRLCIAIVRGDAS